MINELCKYQPNGLTANKSQQLEIDAMVSILENLNRTKSPAYSPKMNGYWKLLYSDFNPPAASSGKLGPFVGSVYQDLNSNAKVIKNILNIKFPAIFGGLIAKQSILNKDTWLVFSISLNYIILYVHAHISIIIKIDKCWFQMINALNFKVVIICICRSIEFEKVGNSVFGIKLPTKYFPNGEQIRLCKVSLLV